jgi:hypothetical protein
MLRWRHTEWPTARVAAKPTLRPLCPGKKKGPARAEPAAGLPFSPSPVPHGRTAARSGGTCGYSSDVVRRLRPLARRRLSMLRPALVSMRVRNPCVLARLRRDGWYVRFILGYGCLGRCRVDAAVGATGTNRQYSKMREEAQPCGGILPSDLLHGPGNGPRAPCHVRSFDRQRRDKRVVNRDEDDPKTP